MYSELLEIANSIEEDIDMEIDTCENHVELDYKLPILDMQCWIQDSGDLVYQHYEKDVSSKLLISERSAHSNGSKRSVHVSELVRRLSNTSVKLDWDKYTAPILSDYMGRMKQAGYSENYRKHVLKNALARFDKRLEDDKNGVSPMNRPTGYNQVERKKQKQMKKKNWYAKGGYTAPIFVPATPGSELANMLRPIAESQSKETGIKLRIVEKGGPTIGKMLQRPNPSASEGCGKEECRMCTQPGGGKLCHKMNSVYKYECNLDGHSYIGETSRNFFSRNQEHETNYFNQKPESFINNHQIEMHGGAQADFKCSVLRTFKDPLSRQVCEGVNIRNLPGGVLNSKLEYYQQGTYTLRREVNHG